jgi:uncharacterized repeat protein (TIGR01451 family)
MRINKFAITILFTAVFMLFAPVVFADSGNYGTYGTYGTYNGEPAPAQTILVDKKVGKITSITKGGVASVSYVDNLSPSDARFKPGSEVMFQIKVKNTSSVTLSNVTIKDFVPSYIEPMEGPGAFDAAGRVIAWDAGSFQPGEEKVYYLKTQLYGQAQMPADKGLFCLVNKAEAYTGSASDSDTAQFCVEKEVLGVKEAPKAGPEAGLLLMGANALLAGIGISLKRLTSQK